MNYLTNTKNGHRNRWTVNSVLLYKFYSHTHGKKYEKFNKTLPLKCGPDFAFLDFDFIKNEIYSNK